MSSRIYAAADAIPAQPLSWPQAGVQPESVADDAQTRAGQIEREADRHMGEARQAGFQEGLASARAETAAETRALTERVAKTVADLAELRPRLRRQAEADLVQLALAIARRILHRELAIDPEALRGLIQAALGRLQSQEICRVRVHPEQEPLLRSLLSQHPQARQVEFLADPTFDRGTAVFETARGNLDASVDTQLREIEQGLTDRLQHS